MAIQLRLQPRYGGDVLLREDDSVWGVWGDLRAAVEGGKGPFTVDRHPRKACSHHVSILDPGEPGKPGAKVVSSRIYEKHGPAASGGPPQFVVLETLERPYTPELEKVMKEEGWDALEEAARPAAEAWAEENGYFLCPPDKEDPR